MDKRSKIVKALMNLGHTNWSLYCENVDDIDTREKFNAAFRKTMYEDINGQAVLSSNPKDFKVTWTQLKAEMDKL
tara:strand:+ start:268 stop:492 length:225 start_codon:yes stop_codon:yes gene_type:complete